MRYESLDNISFTNRNGKTVEIKDMREYPSYITLTLLNIKSEEYIDEIASRSEIYGNGAEDQSYKIVDHNIIKLFESDFNLSKLSSLRIPQ